MHDPYKAEERRKTVTETMQQKGLQGTWQDKVLSIGSAFFTLALIPTLLDSSAAIPLWTSVPTAAFLYIFAYTKWTLRLKLATVAEATTATAWVLVALLRS